MILSRSGESPPQATDRARSSDGLGRPAVSQHLPSPVLNSTTRPDRDVQTREGRRAMRDPLVRWAMAGLILALPVMIFVASATSVAAPPGENRVLATAAVLGPVEVAIGLGLWLASRESPPPRGFTERTRADGPGPCGGPQGLKCSVGSAIADLFDLGPLREEVRNSGPYDDRDSTVGVSPTEVRRATSAATAAVKLSVDSWPPRSRVRTPWRSRSSVAFLTAWPQADLAELVEQQRQRPGRSPSGWPGSCRRCRGPCRGRRRRGRRGRRPPGRRRGWRWRRCRASRPGRRPCPRGSRRTRSGPARSGTSPAP